MPGRDAPKWMVVLPTLALPSEVMPRVTAWRSERFCRCSTSLGSGGGSAAPGTVLRPCSSSAAANGALVRTRIAATPASASHVFMSGLGDACEESTPLGERVQSMAFPHLYHVPASG